TVQWSWGLDGVHDNGSPTPNTAMQQATVNLFADMGAQPTSLQNGLVTATASTDNQPPKSVITSPLNGAPIPFGTTLNITGTATDAGGGVVAAVEISVDGGQTWQAATGTTNWSYSWTTSTTGNVTIYSRSVDDIGNLEPIGTEGATNTITVTIPATQPNCPCYIFKSTDLPVSARENDGQSLELGVKFKPSINGFITGIRFYKGSGTTGTHTGHLWNSTGTSLGQVNFTNETASGWQQALFSKPIAVSAGVTYVASFFSSSGDYANTTPYFSNAVVNGPLRALADGEDGPNGVYRYSATSVFPTTTFQADNYWVDVVFNTSVGPDVTPPSVIATTPDNGTIKVNVNASVSISFDEPLDASTVSNTSITLTNPSGSAVASTVTYNASTFTAILTPSSPLAYSKKYTVKVNGGSSVPAIKDVAGNILAQDLVFTFTTSAPPPPPPTDGGGGPILVVSASSNPFSRYAVEILRAQGLNEFKALDISETNSTVLGSYDVVVLGEMTLTSAQVTIFTDWVNAGGTLITFRPDSKLSSLLGITATGSTLADKYLLVNTTSGPGKGIVNQTIQYHGTADIYTLNGATALATLYSAANTATTNPAVTSRNVGSNGGVAVAFTYDLAKSIIYTRQGNPAWAGQKRDGQIDPIRSDDQFYPNWIDFNKIAIPQADEQQHLLTNIIIQNNLHRKPLPKFWFLPKGFKAAIVMTGDDHGDAGMKPRFDINISESPAGCSVDDWECIRSTGYLFVGNTFTAAQAKQYSDLGFEVALHVNTDCSNVTPSTYQSYITEQMSDFHSVYSNLPLPQTNRNHCITWSNWSTVPEVEAANGMRLDVNYYYWPDVWVQNRPGMFTGSGMPMRFAKIDGTLIDCYQAVTQMPDESGETFPDFSNALLDKALGAEGYYGVFTANMHFDNENHPDANAIVAGAKARGVPVVTAQQMLTWIDGRNNTVFGPLTWDGSNLSFTITQGDGARNLQGMLPMSSASGQLISISKDGASINFTAQIIKGINYAFFQAPTGSYVATYSGGTSNPPVVTTSPQSKTACEGSNVTLSSAATGNPTPTVQWQVSTDNGISWNNISGATSATLSLILTTQMNSNQYQAVWTNSGGVSKSSTATILVNTNPAKPVITAQGSTTFCAGGSVTLSSDKSSGNVWSNSLTTQNIIVMNSGNYSVTYTDANGCSATSDATRVTVNTPPAQPTITAQGPTTFCTGGSVVLTSSATSGNVWSTTETTRSITVQQSGNYTVTVTSNGCSSTSQPATVAVVSAPDKPVITANGPLSFCTGGSVTLTSSAASGNTWSTGETTQSITVSSSGNYTVTVGANGCSATSNPATVSVITAPAKPVITANGPLNFCSGGSVTLTSSATSGNTWSTGETTRSITVSTTGNYSVSVSNGSCTSTSDIAAVSVSSAPNKPTIVAGGPLSFCSGNSVTLTSSASTGNTWSTGETTQSITVSSSGNYTVTVGASGCSATSDAVAVNVTSISKPVITANGPLSFCSGGSVTLTSSATSGNTWSTGETTRSITVSTSGSYTVTVANNGCTATSDPAVVNTSSLTATITPSGTVTICSGGSVKLTANAGTGYTYKWLKNGVETTTTSRTKTVSVAGDFQVVVTQGGCSGTSAVTKVVIDPTVKIDPAGTVLMCNGSSLPLKAIPSSPVTNYQWIKGSTNIAGATSVTYTATASGSYKVRVTNAVGCTATSPATTIKYDTPPATITALGSTNICTTNSVVLQANAGTGFTYQWIKGSTPIAGATAREYTATTTGTYKVKVTNSNGCSKTSSGMKVTKNCTTIASTLTVSSKVPASADRLAVYPNPSTGKIRIDFYNSKQSKEISLNIFEMTGKLVTTKKVATLAGFNQYDLDLSLLASGMYYIELNNDTHNRTKFIIEK
ncbi:MAG: DUF4082 domain-containing protein, partial [Ilyomonas sp.]